MLAGSPRSIPPRTTTSPPSSPTSSTSSTAGRKRRHSFLPRGQLISGPIHTQPRREEIGHETSRVREGRGYRRRSEEHTSELQSLMRISYAVFCLKTKITNIKHKLNKAPL